MVFDWRSRVPVAPHTRATLNVDNLFDQSYRDLPSYNQPPRTFMAGVEVVF